MQHKKEAFFFFFFKKRNEWNNKDQYVVYLEPFLLSLSYRMIAVCPKKQTTNSACKRYTIDCEIPLNQNIQIDRTKVIARTSSVSCSTDLDDCVVFVDRVSVFLEHVHRTLKASERFTPNFPVISFHIESLLALATSVTAAAKFT